MLYNFFVSGTGAAGLAQNIVKYLVAKFNIVGSTVKLIDNLTLKLKVLYRSHDGVSWYDLGGIIFDIGQYVSTFFPATKGYQIVTALWDISAMLWFIAIFLINFYI